MHSDIHTAADYRKFRDWVTEHGGDLFPTVGSLEWFMRRQRKELVESGEAIIRRGPGGIMVGPNFGRIAVAILQREALQREEDSA